MWLVKMMLGLIVFAIFVTVALPMLIEAFKWLLIAAAIMIAVVAILRLLRRGRGGRRVYRYYDYW